MARYASDLFTNLVAGPQVFNDPHKGHARVRRKCATLTVDAAYNNADIFGICRMKAHDHIVDIVVTNQACGTSASYDLGVAEADDSSPAAPVFVGEGADALFDGQSFVTARDVPTSLLGAGTNAPVAADFGKPIWSMIGVATEPDQGTEYDLILTLVTAGDATGIVNIEIWYTAGD